MSDFVHLHNHSEYSLLDGLAKTSDLVKKAKALGMKAIALTDHGVMYGIHEFYVEAVKAGIKPILGCETYLARKSRFDKDPEKDKVRYHQVLLAKNNQGYKNLIKLVTLANLEGYYYKPRIDWEILKQYHEGLIATSGCPQGEIPQALLNKDYEKAEQLTKRYLEIFGEDFYFEIQHHENVPIFEETNKGVIELSRKFGVPVIATNDVHYIDKDDAEAQDALVAIGTKKLISDTDRLTMLDSQTYYVRSEEEMKALFAEIPEAITNTAKIAEKCNIEIKLGNRIMPHFPIPKGMTEDEYLRKHTFEKAAKRFPKRIKEMKDRLDYELGIIIDKGFASYFLIFEDFVNWAKDNGIRVGPGRGSAAGSLVSYVLNITSIDPLFHNLPFERFLNPHRPTPPDIDMDFADDKRDEVIEYVRNKYGEDKVAQIITFGKMEARAAIRDIGRVLGFPYADPDKLAKMIPFGSSIEDAIKTVPEFREAYQLPQYKKLIDLAKKVEGNVRHASIHAAAVVVAPKPFTEYAPLQKDERNNKVVTQYDMHALDCNVDDTALGLLKMDFLGLRNLSILQKAIELVKKEHKVTVNIDNLDLDDKGVYELFAKGETTGVFQMESGGMRRVARSLRPSKFSDIAALVALYRPGPMDLIDDFISGKENPEKITYPHEDLKPVLEETYGIAVYQEQCLEIANVMAGYSLGEADILRRAIGKKKIEVMMAEKKKFLEGAKKKGYSEKVADTVWGYIERFAGYGFNKAHSVSYGMIAYQTAWMKVHYPVEFMTAVLTAESQNKDKITIAVDECRSMGIEINPPSINDSEVNFTIEKSAKSLNGQAIRFGLSAIKNVGTAAIESIIGARKADGRFTSLTDFFSRVDNQKVNKKVIESLIQVGAFDEFGPRSAILSGYDTIRTKAATVAAKKASGQISIFETYEESEEKKGASQQDELPDTDELDKKQLLSWEKQLLGFYLTENPLSKQLSIIKDAVSHPLHELTPEKHVGKHVVLGGALASIRKVFTKKNNSEMAFATLEDDSGSIDMVVFPRIYSECKDVLTEDKVVICEGKIDFREDSLSFIANSITEVNEKDLSFLQEKKEVELTIPRGTDKEVLQQLSELLKAHKGADTVILLLPNGGDIPKRITLPYKVRFSTQLKKEIDKLLE